MLARDGKAIDGFVVQFETFLRRINGLVIEPGLVGELGERGECGQEIGFDGHRFGELQPRPLLVAGLVELLSLLELLVAGLFELVDPPAGGGFLEARENERKVVLGAADRDLER